MIEEVQSYQSNAPLHMKQDKIPPDQYRVNREIEK